MTPLPLLHIAQATNRVTSLDGTLVFVAAVAFTLAAALIWAAPVRSVLRRSGVQRGLRTAMVSLAFLALLPSVLPYDHILVDRSHTAEHEQHKTHCHGAPGQCADAPVPSGPGQILGSDLLIGAPAMLAVLIGLAVIPLVGVSRPPLLRPPLLSPAA